MNGASNVAINYTLSLVASLANKALIVVKQSKIMGFIIHTHSKFYFLGSELQKSARKSPPSDFFILKFLGLLGGIIHNKGVPITFTLLLTIPLNLP